MAERLNAAEDRYRNVSQMAHGVPLRFSSYAGMDIGRDNGDAVSPGYAARSPFPFTGRIGKVVFDLAPR